MAGFKNYSSLIEALNNKVEIAIQNVSNEMVNQLRFYIIEDFYSLYDPDKYKRTYQLQDAPTYEMLSKNMAEIFIDTKNMSYKDTTGDMATSLAALGFHGREDIFRPGFFWEDFVSWASENVPKMLKDELRKQGLNVKNG